jgi:hypothetical protein
VDLDTGNGAAALGLSMIIAGLSFPIILMISIVAVKFLFMLWKRKPIAIVRPQILRVMNVLMGLGFTIIIIQFLFSYFNK